MAFVGSAPQDGLDGSLQCLVRERTHPEAAFEPPTVTRRGGRTRWTTRSSLFRLLRLSGLAELRRGCATWPGRLGRCGALGSRSRRVVGAAGWRGINA